MLQISKVRKFAITDFKLALVVRSTCIFMFSIVAAFVYNWKVSLVLLPIGPVGAVLTGLSGKVCSRYLSFSFSACYRIRCFIPHAA